MLSELVYLLFFESASPDYSALLTILPENYIVRELPQLSLVTTNAPTKITKSIGPVIDAASVFAIDLQTATPLFTKNIFSKRSIASITKLITAMVILDNHQNLDEVVTVSQNAATQEGSRMWLRSGEKMTIRNLITGMMVASANDAAVALAEFDAGSEEAFAEKMNSKALRLGLTQSHFTNAKGFDEAAHFSTAFDTMLFSKAATTYPLIRELALKKSAEVQSVSGDVTHTLDSTDLLLDNPYFKILGLKTGTTPLAGESVVSLAQLSNGREVLVVILGSPDRFKETKIMLEWIEKNYTF